MNITIFIIALTCITSFLAFNNRQVLDNLIFQPYRIWRYNEWHRLLSCSFIHADMGHLFFNMFALYSFGSFIEESFSDVFMGKGHTLFVLMYFGAVATADIYNLFKKRDDESYRSLGASGGVSAVVFSYILLNPFGGIQIFFIPVDIPAFVFGGLYLLYCGYMAKRGTDNVGHMAHFTGSIFGFFFPVLFAPQLLVRFVEQLIHH
ncbi:MAG: rhomboid family intramembrane serine protease [Bacteroidetes bacterium]|nr:rhomboid family intramembrane serine protease [Bacteroidota bacterium]